MEQHHDGWKRRDFLKTAALTLAGVAVPFTSAQTRQFSQTDLQVWSCGGLAEAMMPAHELYEQRTGVKISYTGAFAAALGKSLLGSAQTEVFCGRVLSLSQKLRQTGKMVYFKPLCFTSYVVVTPLGNPAGIRELKDLARPGIKVVLAPDASPPGGKAADLILKKAGLYEAVRKNAVVLGTCVQRTLEDIITGRGDASVVEFRLTKIPRFANKVEVIPIPDRLFPPGPLTFTAGVMQSAKDRTLADDYVDYITSPVGQAFFEKFGFIPAISAQGQELTEKLGVKDV
ncbi:MAG TPA: molybdenum ABC transporter substrate-binding protein [Desulfobacterales bacterium]|nr:molybdenum ABC transporter substrate-binding protein [Desulfobacterales bacterium]